MIAFPKTVCFVWICEMEFYKMDLKKNVPRHILFHAFCVRTNLYLRIVPVNGTIIGGILNR